MNDPYNRISFPKNQKDAIIAYIQKHGSIDFLQAANHIGCSQLTGRIAELRQDGWEFDKSEESGVNRYGNGFRKVVYSNARRL